MVANRVFPAQMETNAIARGVRIWMDAQATDSPIEPAEAAKMAVDEYSGKGQSRQEPSEADINITAKKYGMTPEQVRKKLGL